VVQAVHWVSICFAAGRRVVVFDLIVIYGGVCSSTASVVRLSLLREKRIGGLILGSLKSADLHRMPFNDISSPLAWDVTFGSWTLRSTQVALSAPLRIKSTFFLSHC
jgi:hypothetical protein